MRTAKAFWTEMAGFVVAADHPMGPHARWLEAAPAIALPPAGASLPLSVCIRESFAANNFSVTIFQEG